MSREAILDAPPAAAVAVLGAMRAVALEHGGPDLTEMDRETIGSAGLIVFGLGEVDVDAVAPVDPPGLARAVGDEEEAMRAIRMLSVMFGGACAGLAGAYLPLAYTPFFIPGMTAGRGWIALALVVFASWLPGRLIIGAYLFGAVTILQLHAQGWGIGIPSQFMSALPYLATVIVLVLISRARTGGSTAPAALGTVFVPDR